MVPTFCCNTASKCRRRNVQLRRIQNRATGQFQATLTYENRKGSIRVYVLPDNCPPIFGKDTIRVLGLQVDGVTSSVRAIGTRASTTTILSSYPDLQRLEIGRFPDFEHRIVLMEDARPTARPPRPVPVSRRAAVDNEIESIVKNGIWERVT